MRKNVSKIDKNHGMKNLKSTQSRINNFSTCKIYKYHDSIIDVFK